MAGKPVDVLIDIEPEDIPYSKIESGEFEFNIEIHNFHSEAPIKMELRFIPLHDVSNPFLWWEGIFRFDPGDCIFNVRLSKEKVFIETKSSMRFELENKLFSNNKRDALYRIFYIVLNPETGEVIVEAFTDRFLLFNLYGSEYLRVLEEKHLNKESISYKDSKNFNLLGTVRGNEIADFLERKKEIKGSSLLDLGCATGGPSIALKTRGAEVTALDVDPILIELTSIRAHEEGQDIGIIRGDGFHLPFHDETFDIVVMADVYEHVKNPEQMLFEIQRVLRKNGILYISAPNRFSRNNIKREPHYGLPGIILMPRRIASWWVTRIKKTSSTYELYKIPHYFSLLKSLVKCGFSVDESHGFEIIKPQLINGYITKILGKILRLFRLSRLIDNKYYARLRLFFARDSLHFIAEKR
jgi:2-polyprenyl-3-methyl-5-hydroxy-6-metoxy-1,4-benzoquinol methylase